MGRFKITIYGCDHGYITILFLVEISFAERRNSGKVVSCVERTRPPSVTVPEELIDYEIDGWKKCC